MRRYKSEHRRFGELIEETRPGYRLRHWVVTAMLLVLTFLHGRSRRPSKGTLLFWLAFVALFNLAGFLTYWALNHTPIIKCLSCGKRRGLAQAGCAPMRRAAADPGTRQARSDRRCVMRRHHPDEATTMVTPCIVSPDLVIRPSLRMSRPS